MACVWFLPSFASAQRQRASWSSLVHRERLPEETANFWRRVRDPDAFRCAELTERGIGFLRQSRASQHQSDLRAAYTRSALLRLSRAAVLCPNDADVLYWQGVALSQLIQNQQSPELTQAIGCFERVHRLDPDYAPSAVLFELGLLYSRVDRPADSITAYEQSIARAPLEHQTGTTYSNLAETRMQSGDLMGAVRDYERAIQINAGRLSSRQTELDALPLFGLAVALDRLGETEGALHQATRAIHVGGIHVLRSNGVFYEPESEIHYYEAIAHQAVADAEDGEAKVQGLRHALRSWQTYLRLATDDDPWRSIVETRAATVRQSLAALAPAQ